MATKAGQRGCQTAPLGAPTHRHHIGEMKTILISVIALGLCGTGVAHAQVGTLPWQTRPDVSSFDAHRYRVEQHRLDMEQLRLRTDQRQLEAQQDQLRTQLNLRRIEAARQPEPLLAPPLPGLRSPDQERTARIAAERRRPVDTTALNQIDAWLDRPVP